MFDLQIQARNSNLKNEREPCFLVTGPSYDLEPPKPCALLFPMLAGICQITVTVAENA